MGGTCPQLASHHASVTDGLTAWQCLPGEGGEGPGGEGPVRVQQPKGDEYWHDDSAASARVERGAGSVALRAVALAVEVLLVTDTS